MLNAISKSKEKKLKSGYGFSSGDVTANLDKKFLKGRGDSQIGIKFYKSFFSQI